MSVGRYTKRSPPCALRCRGETQREPGEPPPQALLLHDHDHDKLETKKIHPLRRVCVWGVDRSVVMRSPSAGAALDPPLCVILLSPLRPPGKDFGMVWLPIRSFLLHANKTHSQTQVSIDLWTAVSLPVDGADCAGGRRGKRVPWTGAPRCRQPEPVSRGIAPIPSFASPLSPPFVLQRS